MSPPPTAPSEAGSPSAGDLRLLAALDLGITLIDHGARSLPFPPPKPGDLSPLDIIGNDDRQEITDASVRPWSMLCHLVVLNDRGRWITGTGWLGGPSTVFTAGHVLLDAQQDHRAHRVWALPGRVRKSALGQFEANGFDTHVQWKAGQPPGFDVGVVWLPQPIGQRWGWFGFKSLPDAQLQGRTVISAGYPDDKEKGTPMVCHGPIDGVDTHLLRYALDTMPGQSGSPVFELDAQQLPTALGVHAYGNRQANHAVRLSADVVQQFAAWYR